MKVDLQKTEKLNKSTKIIYILIVVICIIALIVALYFQLFVEKDKETLNKEIADEEYATLQAEFEDIFDNSIKNVSSISYDISKLDDEKEIIYTGYQNTETEDTKYSLNINLPCINIKNSKIEEYNSEITEIFQAKAENIISNSSSRNVIYTVNYTANIYEDILSVIIHSTLKEGSSAQRDIIKTYNYNLKTNKEISIDDALNLMGISKDDAYSKIQEKIKEKQDQINELAQLGYSVYNRDYTSDIYKIENIEEFFIGENNHLYVIFAYGNDNLTNEKDVVIF